MYNLTVLAKDKRKYGNDILMRGCWGGALPDVNELPNRHG